MANVNVVHQRTGQQAELPEAAQNGLLVRVPPGPAAHRPAAGRAVGSRHLDCPAG